MDTIFVSVLNMSFTASIVIVAILAVRLILSRSPKIFSYALWGVVLFRLLCPFSLRAGISLLSFMDSPVATVGNSVSVISYMPLGSTETEAFSEGYISPERDSMLSSIQEPAPAAEFELLQIFTWIWFLGLVVMLLHSIVFYWKNRQMLSESIPIMDHIFEGDQLPTAFVLGIFHPNIYLPSSLSKEEQSFIISHEQHHIRRKDHIWKLLGYIALCIHWFNPLVWISFILAAKDMEMSCDEAVIKNMGMEVRADYAASLVNLSSSHWSIANAPLSFGGGNTHQRVLHLAKLKKPAVYTVVLAAILSCTVILCLAFNPKDIISQTPKSNYIMAVDPEINSLGGTLIIGKAPDDTSEISTTSDYWLEREQNRRWKKLPDLSAAQENTSTTVDVTYPPKFETLNWEQRYGALPAGKYRIDKYFTVNGQTSVMYAGFRVYAAEIPGTEEQLAVEKCYRALDSLKDMKQLHYTISSSAGDIREVYRNGDNFYQLWTYPDDYPGENNQGRIEGIVTLNGASYKLEHEISNDPTSLPTAWKTQKSPVGIYLETQFFRNSSYHIYFPEDNSEISEKRVSFLTDYTGSPYYRYCRVIYEFEQGDRIAALTWDSTNWYHDSGTITIRFYNDSAEDIEAAIEHALTEYPIQ